MSNSTGEIHSIDSNPIVSKGVALVDFWAPWCGPCKIQASILDQLAGEINGKAAIVKVNVDEAADAAGQFGIQAIPTLVLIKDGMEIQRFIGVQSKDTLIHAIRPYL